MVAFRFVDLWCGVQVIRVLLELVFVSSVALGCAALVPVSHPHSAQETIQLLQEGGAGGPWTHLDVHDEPGAFRFAVVADRTTSHRPGVFATAVADLNLLQPAFVISVGDQIEGYTRDESTIDAEWDELLGIVSELEMPYFATPGNHDFTNSVMAQKWKERFGPSYTSFRYKDVLFLILNSQLFEGMGIMDVADPQEQVAQMAFIEETLQSNTDVRWTFVFIHRPFWRAAQPPADWERIDAWLGARPHTVFAGHSHQYSLDKHSGFDRITLSVTGGGSDLRGLDYGEFDHFAWVTMDERGPVIANVLLDGVVGKDLSVRELKRLRKQMLQGVSMESFLPQEEVVRGGRVRFNFQNPLDRALRIRGQIPTGRHLAPSIESFDETLAPGEERTLDVQVDATVPVALEEASPLIAEWTMSVMRDDGSRFDVRRETAIIPERIFSISAPEKPVVIDGVLDEWESLAFRLQDPAEVTGRPTRRRDFEEGTLRFALRADSDFLYLAAEVRDDDLEFDPERSVWDQDAFVFSVDARPEPARSANTSFNAGYRKGEWKKLLFTAITLSPEPSGIKAFIPSYWPEGMVAAMQRTEQGYRVEVAIPSAFLDEAQGESWRTLRINVGANDVDDGGREKRTYWWRPDRFGEMVIPGAGMFQRQAK